MNNLGKSIIKNIPIVGDIFKSYEEEEDRDYQKQLNQTQMDREDTNYQRTVEDMNMAGLSPLSMGSTNTSTAGTVTTTGDSKATDNALNMLNSISAVAKTIKEINGIDLDNQIKNDTLTSYQDSGYRNIEAYQNALQYHNDMSKMEREEFYRQNERDWKHREAEIERNSDWKKALFGIAKGLMPSIFSEEYNGENNEGKKEHWYPDGEHFKFLEKLWDRSSKNKNQYKGSGKF